MMRREELEAGGLFECVGGFFRRIHAIQDGCIYYIGGRNKRHAMLDGTPRCCSIPWFAQRAIRKLED